MEREKQCVNHVVNQATNHEESENTEGSSGGLCAYSGFSPLELVYLISTEPTVIYTLMAQGYKFVTSSID